MNSGQCIGLGCSYESFSINTLKYASYFPDSEADVNAFEISQVQILIISILSNCTLLCLLSSPSLWLLYLYKYLPHLACSSVWKTQLSSWEVRSERWSFPFASQTLWLLEFHCKWQFLLCERNRWMFERWEKGLKDLSNKPWEVPFRCDWGSLLCGYVCFDERFISSYVFHCNKEVANVAWRKSEQPR